MKRRLCALSALTLLAIALAGCSGSDSTDGPDPDGKGPLPNNQKSVAPSGGNNVTK